MEPDPTIVEYFAEHERYRCGYCGSKDTNYSHGMWAHQMSVQDYQDLIDRGWRRSGKYCYKPTMNMTCCPQYTIKCGALDFKLNKSHKKIIKRVNKYLISGVKPGHSSEGTAKREEDEADDEHEATSKSVESALAEKAKPSDVDLPSSVKKKKEAKEGRKSQSDTAVLASTSGAAKQLKSASASDVPREEKKKDGDKTSQCPPRLGAGPDPNKPKCRKAKEIRKERKAMKQAQSGDTGAQPQMKKGKQNEAKSLEDFLSEPDHAENPAHKLELRLIRSSPASDAFTSSFDRSHVVYHKYQMAIHKDPPGKPNKSQYTQFLCDSPLAERHEQPGPPQGYGSFHHHYLLDGKLIAVGVVDVLPYCVSSVYLYYDPDYSFLGLGVYSALREIALVRELHRSAPTLQYYYMGFYIHSCPKMRYKGQYFPSFLVCPESYQWVPIERCRPKLDVSVYARFAEPGAEDKDKDIDVNQVLILHKGNMLPYAFYKLMKSKGSDEEEVKEYAGFVGKTCAERMLLVRK